MLGGVFELPQLDQRFADVEAGLIGFDVLRKGADERAELVDSHFPARLAVMPSRHRILVFGSIGSGRSRDERQQQS